MAQSLTRRVLNFVPEIRIIKFAIGPVSTVQLVRVKIACIPRKHAIPQLSRTCQLLHCD